jgi:hypothetical protein
MCVLVGACIREGRDESVERVGAGGMAVVGEGNKGWRQEICQEE